MRKLFLITAMLAVYGVVWAQLNRASRLFEYRPAPGQFINNPIIGTPEAAKKILSADNNLVSLGAFGGYIVLGFEKPVKNHPNNPHGIDFTIFGNAFTGSSEPGIIWVMKDENGNGLPDGNWYQIAGSSYFHPNTNHDYQITWYNQPDGSAAWKDNLGKTGRMLKNEFHSQPYYPSPQYFTTYPTDSVTLSGTMLGHTPLVVNGQVVMPTLAFGYADNRPLNRHVSLTIPDNPYTPEKREGAGGDPVDISWAVDSLGNYIDLDEIHFLKIVTGAMADIGVLGEISTEIGGVVATEPTGETGKQNLTVIHPHALTMLVNDSMLLYAHFFQQGRKQDIVIVFENSDRTKADISPSGAITAIDGGIIRVSAVPEGFTEEKVFTEIFIRRPNSIMLTGLKTQLMAGETLTIKPILLDQDNSEIIGISWVFESQNTELISVALVNGSYTLKALMPGEAIINVYPEKFPDLKRAVNISIQSVTEKTRVYVTAKTSEENLLPAQWIDLVPFSVNSYIDKRRGDYSAKGFVSLAQVAAAALNKADITFSFRDDEAAGSALYLYMAENEGLFNYGWGGKTEPSAFAKAWIIRHNRHHFLNKFDEIAVANGDTVIIYHENNILNDWVLTGLIVTPDSVYKGRQVNIFNWKVKCTRNTSGEISESEFLPVAGQPVMLGTTTTPAGFTNVSGNLTLALEQNPPWIIYAGNDAVMITERVVTNVNMDLIGQINVYPNPANSYINVSGINPPSIIRIIDTSGRTRIYEPGNSANIQISTDTLKQGVYIIVIEDDIAIHRIKFIKK